MKITIPEGRSFKIPAETFYIHPVRATKADITPALYEGGPYGYGGIKLQDLPSGELVRIVGAIPFMEMIVGADNYMAGKSYTIEY